MAPATPVSTDSPHGRPLIGLTTMFACIRLDGHRPSKTVCRQRDRPMSGRPDVASLDTPWPAPSGLAPTSSDCDPLVAVVIVPRAGLSQPHQHLSFANGNTVLPRL